MLAGDIRQAVEPVGQEPRCRSGVDDVAPALGDQVGEEHEVAPGHAQQVEVEDPLPGLDRQGLRSAHGQDAHVVHDDIEPAVAVEAPVPQRFEVGLLGHVDTERVRLATGFDDEGRGLLGAGGVKVAGHDASASSREGDRRRSTHATAGARERGDGSFQLQGDGHAIATALVRTNSSRPSRPPSRPNPEIPTPPKGSSQPVTGEAPFT